MKHACSKCFKIIQDRWVVSNDPMNVGYFCEECIMFFVLKGFRVTKLPTIYNK